MIRRLKFCGNSPANCRQPNAYTHIYFSTYSRGTSGWPAMAHSHTLAIVIGASDDLNVFVQDPSGIAARQRGQSIHDATASIQKAHHSTTVLRVIGRWRA